jgi:predicted GNAT family acetyltransferase
MTTPNGGNQMGDVENPQKKYAEYSSCYMSNVIIVPLLCRVLAIVYVLRRVLSTVYATKATRLWWRLPVRLTLDKASLYEHFIWYSSLVNRYGGLKGTNLVVSSETTEGISVLNNPVWHALNTHHARIAIGTDLARSYPPQIGVFAAVANHQEAAFNDLARIVAKGQTIKLFETRLPPQLPGWNLNRTYSTNQMVCTQPVAEPKSDVEIIDLFQSDVSDMLRLIELAHHSGPFFSRTIELGHYIGIRHQEQLIAMAGERLSFPGYCEVSAVCTAPKYRGKGYARLLISRLINENWQRGNVPFLHVAPDNSRAIRLYESLHFYKRAELQVSVLSR